MARSRSGEKRQEIIRIAAELFQEFGYDRSSMAVLSQRVGGSKSTLYAYFPSKEDLLKAVLAYDVGQSTEQIMRGCMARPICVPVSSSRAWLTSNGSSRRFPLPTCERWQASRLRRILASSSTGRCCGRRGNVSHRSSKA